MRSIRAIVIVLMALTGLVSCSRDPASAKKHYLESGDRYYAKGRYKEAAIQYSNALKIDQRFGPAHYKLALADLKKVPHADLGGALKSLRRAVELLRNNQAYQAEYLDSMVKLSELYLVFATDKQSLDEVDTYCSILLKRDPNSFDGHRLRGNLDLLLAEQAFQGRGTFSLVNMDEGRRLLGEAFKEFSLTDAAKPNNPVIAWALARILVLQQKFPEAEIEFEKAISLDKTRPEPYSNLYSLYITEGKPADGERVLKLAFQNNPKDFNWLQLLARHYASQNRRDDMINVLREIKSHAGEWPGAYLKVGDFYLALGDGDSAVNEYREGMVKDPKAKADYQKHIIEVLMRQGKRSEAAEVNGEILKSNPKDNDARNLAATLLLDKGDIAKATLELESVVQRAPDNYLAHYNLGRAYVARGQWVPAKEQFEKAMELKPNYLQARLTLAQLELTQGDYDGALKGAQEVLQRYDRNNLDARLIESAALSGQKKYGDSKALLSTLVKANPGSPGVYYQLGVVALQEGRYQDAEESFKRSYELNPANVRSLMGMVETDMRQNKVDAAMQLLLTESKKAPNRVDLLVGLGSTATRAGHYDEALGYYQRVLDSLDKDSKARADIYLRMGDTYRMKGDNNNAIASLQKARAVLPDNEAVLLDLAMTLDQAGSRPDARSIYEAVVRIDPNQSTALNNLAYLMVETGLDSDVALSYAQRAKQLMPDMPEISDTLGWIYLKKAQFDSAVNIFQELVVKSPGHSTFHYHLAMAYKMKGDKGKAIQELHEALRYNPTKTERQDITQLLEQLGAS